MERLREQFGAARVVGFCPTGWLYEMKKNAFPVRVKGECEVHLVPYSEHSSFKELQEFVGWLKPKKVRGEGGRPRGRGFRRGVGKRGWGQCAWGKGAAGVVGRGKASPLVWKGGGVGKGWGGDGLVGGRRGGGEEKAWTGHLGKLRKGGQAEEMGGDIMSEEGLD